MRSASFRTIYSRFFIAALCFAGAHAFAKSTDESYALVRDGQRTTFVGSHSSDDTKVDSLKKQYPGNFIWFRQSGKAYILRDAATLNQINAAWAPTEQLGQDMKKFDADMRVQSNGMTALGREMTAAARSGRSGETEAIGKKMDALGKTMDAIGKQMDTLGKQIERTSKQADASSRALMRAAVASGAAQAVPAR